MSIIIDWLHDPHGPKRITISGNHDTIAYRLRREDVQKDMPEEFYDKLHTPGVYVLLGKRKLGTGTEIYVGQSEDLAQRFNEHRGGREDDDKKTGKKFWDECIGFVTQSELEVSHARYLEKQLYDLIEGTGYFTFNNEVKPRFDSAKEKTEEEGDAVINDAMTISAALDWPLFKDADFGEEFAGIPALHIRYPEGGDEINAAGHHYHTKEFPTGFLVHAGSKIRLQATPKASHAVIRMRRDLEKYNVIGKRGEDKVFLNSRIFESPGIAASVVFGRSASANEWKQL